MTQRKTIYNKNATQLSSIPIFRVLVCYFTLMTRKSFLLSMIAPFAPNFRALRAAFHNRYFSTLGRSGLSNGIIIGVYEPKATTSKSFPTSDSFIYTFTLS